MADGSAVRQPVVSPAYRAAGQLTYRAAEQSADRTTAQSTDRAPAQSTNWTAEQGAVSQLSCLPFAGGQSRIDGHSCADDAACAVQTSATACAVQPSETSFSAQSAGVPYAIRSAKARPELALAEVPSSEGSLMIPYEIRRNARSRYIRLTLGEAGQARLSVPRHCSQTEALAFLRTQGEWLNRQLQKIPARVSLRSHFTAHPQLYALSHSLHVTLGRTRGRSYYLYSLRPAEILFQLHCGDGADAEAELLAQLRAFAAEVIPLRTRELAQERGIRYSRVSVRDQSSRWGSCSTTGTVSLNWRLILLRPHLQDHIILHELAHLREMNHSENFWNLLRSYDPHCDAHNGQLNVAATKVMSLGRTKS